jgi:hypothetical protein
MQRPNPDRICPADTRNLRHRNTFTSLPVDLQGLRTRDWPRPRTRGDGPVPQSAAGRWIAPGPVGYGAYSPGFYGATVWKGFQRNHALGLELIQSNAESRADGVSPRAE